MNRALWTIQALLAALFLFAGAMKWILPLDQMVKMMGVPGWLIRFTGAAEMLGAIGLMLPGLLRIAPALTPLAGLGLTVVMAGAVTVTLATGGGASASIPAAIGALAGFVAYARWRLAPLAGAGSARAKFANP